MPHIRVEYSSNIERGDERIRALLDDLARAAKDTGLLPEPGLRARASRSDIFRVGNGQVDGAFVHIEVRIGPGRSLEQRQRIADELFAVAKDSFAEDSAARALALSLELDELGLRHNHNNLREHMPE